MSKKALKKAYIEARKVSCRAEAKAAQSYSEYALLKAKANESYQRYTDDSKASKDASAIVEMLEEILYP